MRADLALNKTVAFKRTTNLRRKLTFDVTRRGFVVIPGDQMNHQVGHRIDTAGAVQIASLGDKVLTLQANERK